VKQKSAGQCEAEVKSGLYTWRQCRSAPLKGGRYCRVHAKTWARVKVDWEVVR